MSLKKFRKLLGDHADNMTEEEIIELRRLQYELAKIGIKVWEEAQKHKKKLK